MASDLEPNVEASLLRQRVARAPLWVTVQGPSMGKAIGGGDRVLVSRALKPRRGEIWAFVDDGGNLVVHRFRSEYNRRHWFVGDANVVDDRPVTAVRIVGRVVEVESNGRRRRLGTASRIVGRARLDLRSARRMFRRLLRRGGSG